MINEEKLTNAYKKISGLAREDKKTQCPSPKKLLKLTRDELSVKRREKVAAHLESCSDCVNHVKFISELLNEEGMLLSEIQSSSKNYIIRDHGHYKKWRPLTQIKLITAGVAALIIIVSISGYFLIISKKSDNHRTLNPVLIELTAPDTEVPLKSDLIFRWNRVKEADYYILEFSRDSMKLIWQEDLLENSMFILPADKLSTLEPNVTYYWKITAVLKNGERVKSRLRELTLSRQK